VSRIHPPGQLNGARDARREPHWRDGTRDGADHLAFDLGHEHAAGSDDGRNAGVNVIAGRLDHRAVRAVADEIAGHCGQLVDVLLGCLPDHDCRPPSSGYGY